MTDLANGRPCAACGEVVPRWSPALCDKCSDEERGNCECSVPEPPPWADDGTAQVPPREKIRVATHRVWGLNSRGAAYTRAACPRCLELLRARAEVVGLPLMSMSLARLRELRS